MSNASVAMSSFETILLTAYYLILCAACFILAAGLWPRSAHLIENESHVRLFWKKSVIPREVHLALLTIVLGFLGATARYLWWFSDHAAMGDLKAAQFIIYLVKPWIGGSVALILYGLVRGGVTSGPGAAAELNPFGIGGLAGLVGLYANDVIAKLQTLLH